MSGKRTGLIPVDAARLRRNDSLRAAPNHAFIDMAYGRRFAPSIKGQKCIPKRNSTHPRSCTNTTDVQAHLHGRMHPQTVNVILSTLVSESP